MIFSIFFLREILKTGWDIWKSVFAKEWNCALWWIRIQSLMSYDAAWSFRRRFCLCWMSNKVYRCKTCTGFLYFGGIIAATQTLIIFYSFVTVELIHAVQQHLYMAEILLHACAYCLKTKNTLQKYVKVQIKSIIWIG